MFEFKINDNLGIYKYYPGNDTLKIVDDIHLLQSKENLNLLIEIIANHLKENKKVFLAINWWESYDSGILDYIEKSLYAKSK